MSDVTVAEKKTKVHYSGPITLDNIGDEEAPKRGSDKEGADLTPFKKIVELSNVKRLENHPKPAVGITILAESAQLIETRLRQAAVALELGVGIARILHDSERGIALKLSPEQLRLVVTAKQRKKSQKAAEAATTPVLSADSPVVVPAGNPAVGKKAARI